MKKINDLTTLIKKVESVGYSPCGSCSMEEKDGNIILKTAMY